MYWHERRSWAKTVGWASLALAAICLVYVYIQAAQEATAAGGWQVLAFSGINVRQVAVDHQSANTLHAIIGEDTQVISNDGGQTWRSVLSDPRPFLVRDPNRSQAYFRWAPWPNPAGIERSTDDGHTWASSWLSPTGYANPSAMAAPPSGTVVPSLVLANVVVNASQDGFKRLFLRTIDGGESWGELGTPPTLSQYSRQFETFAFDITRGISFGATGGDYFRCGSDLCPWPPALIRSTDYFQNDFGILTLPPRIVRVTGLAFTAGQLLLLGREDPNQTVSNVWQSPDDGRNWFPLFSTSLVYPQSPYLTAIAIWPGTPTRILLGTSDGLLVRDLPAIQHSYLPLVNNRVIAGW